MRFQKSKIKSIKLTLLNTVHAVAHEMRDNQTYMNILTHWKVISKNRYISELVIHAHVIQEIENVVVGMETLFRVHETQKLTRDDVIPILAILGLIKLECITDQTLFSRFGKAGMLEMLSIFTANETQQSLTLREHNDQANSKTPKTNSLATSPIIQNNDTIQIIEMLMKKKKLTRSGAALFAIEHDLI